MKAQQMAQVAAPVLRDLVGISGAVLMAYGIWQIYPPAAIILAGLCLVLLAVSWAKRSG